METYHMETFYPKGVEDLREFIQGKWQNQMQNQAQNQAQNQVQNQAQNQVHMFLHGECIGHLADETCLLTNNQITLMLRDSSGKGVQSHVFLESRLRAYKFQFAE